MDHQHFTRRLGSHEHLTRVEGRDADAHVTEHGDTHHLLKDVEHPQMQQCIARLVKSVVRISDVSLHDGKYYSYQPDLSSSPQDFTYADAYADFLVLGFVFNDVDHQLIEEKNAFPFGFNIANARLVDGRYAVFDTGDAYKNFWKPFIPEEKGCPPERKEFYLRYPPHVATRFHARVTRLMSEYGSEQGRKDFYKIIDSVGADCADLFGPDPSGRVVTKKHIYNQCMKRLRIAERHARIRSERT